MNVYRKSIVVQLLLFIVFAMMGAYTIIEHFLRAQYPWMGYILLGTLIACGALGFYLFKRPDNRICVMTEKDMLFMRYLLYGYFAVYVTDMLLPSLIKTINLNVLNVTAGILLMIIAFVGIAFQLKILEIKKK